MTDRQGVIAWLLDSDPALRWQVQRDLLGRPEAEWRAERARVETDGWGARLLACADPDGQWAGAAFWPAGFTEDDWRREGQAWTATCFALDQLREFGLPPDCPSARRVVDLVGRNSRWEEGDQPFWQGEVEECINGRTVASGAYFGVDVAAIVARLQGEQLPDGGWNCERAAGSRRGSFDTTINVLEGLLEFERATGGTAASRAARAAGEEYLRRRGLFRRLSTGEPVAERYTSLAYPLRWQYDVLRGLDYFRAAATLDARPPDPRLAGAVELLGTRRGPDGTWALERSLGGRVWFGLDEEVGLPSRWLTLRALRVLDWAAPERG
jgi:hypothetical protein